MVPKVIDNFSARIVGNFTPSATTITLDTPVPTITSGYLTVFDFDGNQFEKIKFTAVSGNDITVIRGLSFLTASDTPPGGLAQSLQNGMVVKLTMSLNSLNPIVDALNGDVALEGIPKLPASRTFNNARQIIDKEYADAISSAGITSMLVTDNGGITVNINTGYYLLNGVVKTYAGAAAQALTNNATNYIQIVDSTLVINTSGFVNNAIPLAIAVTVAGDITSLTDTRPFYTGVDVRAGVNGSMICGAASTSVAATWAAITNGSFRCTIDGTAYNFDAINFTGCTTMELVAAAIQTKVRAITGGQETVTWVTDHFVITSGTTGTTSTVSVLSTSTGTVGTDISGAGSPTYMNGTAGTTSIGTESGLLVDSAGIYISLDTTPGLEFHGNALRVKIKSSGGIVRDANGLSVDMSIVKGYDTITAGESLAASNLLKFINESGTGKLKKIIGLPAEMTPAIADLSTEIEVAWLTSNLIVILYWVNEVSIAVQAGTITNNVLTLGSAVSVNVGNTVRDFCLRKVDTTRFIVGYRKTDTGPSNAARVRIGSVSGTTITLGSDNDIETNSSTSNTNRMGMSLVNLGSTDKWAFIYFKDAAGSRAVVLNLSGTSLASAGTIVNVKTSNPGPGLDACALATDRFAVVEYDSSTSKVVGYTCDVSTNTITVNSENSDLVFTPESVSDRMPMKMMQLTTNVFCLIGKNASAKTTLDVKIYTCSGATITNGTLYQETSFLLNVTQNEFSAALIGNILHIVGVYGTTIKFLKMRFDGTSKLQRMSLSPAITFTGSTNYFSMNGMCVYNGDRIFMYSGNSNTSANAMLGLPDWDEFITCPNASYALADNVPIVELFSGFSSLVPGMKYYIKQDASGVTIDSTHQIVGKAISSTSILKTVS